MTYPPVATLAPDFSDHFFKSIQKQLAITFSKRLQQRYHFPDSIDEFRVRLVVQLPQ
jgi:hypothetical protein